MSCLSQHLKVKLATTAEELQAAQRLRYAVFVDELGGGGVMVDHDAGLEIDRFDAYYEHLILVDTSLDVGNMDRVVGVYRLLDSARAGRIGQFYSEGEYDLNVLKKSGRRLLELGRSCIHADYRGGDAMYRLWQGLAAYIKQNNIEILFGVASFHGTNVENIAPSLSLLHHNYLAPKDLRVCAKPAHFQKMDILDPQFLDRAAAMIAIPSLIKSYLRLGGFVGHGAFVDHAFNTTDICLILDIARMNPRLRAGYYEGGIK